MSDRPTYAQALILLGLTCVALLPLGGCGKRADRLELPPDTEISHYPQGYPDTNTDPPATYKPQ